MRMRNLLYALGIGCTLCACSSHEDFGVEEEKDYTKSNKYVSVSIVTPSDGTRADETYDDGDESEYNVTGVGFYFFDRQGKCAYTAYYNNVEFTTEGAPVTPGCTVMGTVEVELKANSVYASVVAILNPDAHILKDGKPIEMSLDELKAHKHSFSGEQNNGYTMSNSVYRDTSTDDAGYDFVEVPITSHQIYIHDAEYEAKSDAEKASFRADKAVNIYVERVCSKILVEKQPTFGAYFVDENGTTKDIEVRVLGGTAEKPESVNKKIRVRAVYRGMGLSVTATEAKLIKDISNFDFTEDAYKNFAWNDQTNKRSYWETTVGSEKKHFNYTSWNTLSPKNQDGTFKPASSLKRYINPNTRNAKKGDSDEQDLSTKLLVTAQLEYVDVADGESEDDIAAKTGTALDLVKYSDGYWMADYFLFHAATRAQENLSDIDYTEIAADKVEAAKTAVGNITVDKIKANIELVNLNSDMEEAYLAKLAIKTDADFLADVTDEELKAKLAELVKADINQTLDELTSRQIQYWKDGQTYFYVPIRHEGFTGLVGSLNGVVRNHVYKINIQKIWGLGTPVIDPNKEIDPERPADAPPSYMTAQINVLKWRVVTSNAILH